MMEPMATALRPSFNSIEAKFYSFGMYRRGDRSHVTMRRAGYVRAASKAEIAERERKTGDMMPCQTLQREHFGGPHPHHTYLHVRYGSSDLSMGEFFFCSLCLCFLKDSWSPREGGLITFSKRGTEKRCCKEGGLLSDPAPFFTLPVSPRFAK
jgi:hypothetical protein